MLFSQLGLSWSNRTEEVSMGGRRISLTSANDADVRIVVKNKKVTIRLELPERTTRRLLTQLKKLEESLHA